MNTLVKTFIVINLILSTLFCAFSIVLFANRNDWKQKWADSEYNYQKQKGLHESFKLELDKEIEANRVKVEALNQNIVTILAERDSYLDNLKTAQTDIVKLKEEVERKSLESSKLINTLDKKSEELSLYLNQLEEAREIAQGSRTDLVEIREQVVSFKKERGALMREMEVLSRAKGGLEDKLKEKEWTISKISEQGIDIPDIVERAGEPDVPIHGKVLAVKGEVNVVLLSVGSQDNVKEGFRFTVYRGGSYIGKVQIENVYPNMASARILTKLAKRSMNIEEGDSASTRVY